MSPRHPPSFVSKDVLVNGHFINIENEVVALHCLLDLETVVIAIVEVFREISFGAARTNPYPFESLLVEEPEKCFGVNFDGLLFAAGFQALLVFFVEFDGGFRAKKQRVIFDDLLQGYSSKVSLHVDSFIWIVEIFLPLSQSGVSVKLLIEARYGGVTVAVEIGEVFEVP